MCSGSLAWLLHVAGAKPGPCALVPSEAGLLRRSFRAKLAESYANNMLNVSTSGHHSIYKSKENLLCMDLVKYLTFSFLLFLLGIWGIFFNRKNIIIMLMSIELMLLAVNLNFLVFSVYLDDLIGQLFALFVLTVAAAESAIGLALLVVYYRVRGTIAVEFISLLKG